MGGRPIASLICVTIVVLPHSPRIVLPLALQPPPKSFNMFSTKLLAVFSLIVALCNAQTPTDVSDASSQNISFLVLAVVMLQLFLTVSAQTPTDVSSAVGLVPGACRGCHLSARTV